MLPFRVTVTDSLLGEGVAEVLALEFTGEGGPRVVPMATMLRAWRRAGGGLRSPLPQADAIRLAGELGAGRVVNGSVVGLGTQLRLAASVLTVPGGATRQVPAVTGAADSLPVLLGRLAAGVLAAAGGGATSATQRLSDSVAAIRAYIEGMAAFRRGRFGDAAGAFERAFAADTLFARAAFMRWTAATWGPGFGTPTQALWASRAVGGRDRLSAGDRVVLDAAFGDRAAKERATVAAPHSFEAWYYLGDSYFHSARREGWTSALARARDAFERSVALDTQTTSLHHLLEIGLLTRDTALLRAVWPSYDRLQEGRDQVMGWLVASRLGDGRLLDALRRRPATPFGDGQSMLDRLGWGPEFGGLSAAMVDELYQRMRPGAGVPAASRLEYFYALTVQGRPAAAAAVAREGPVADTTVFAGFAPDLWFAVAGALGDGDTVLAAAAAARLRDSRLVGADRARARCALALRGALRGDPVPRDDDVAMRSDGMSACAELVDVVTAQRAGTLDSARLARVDSLYAGRGVPFAYAGVMRLLLARAWESLGSRQRALFHARSTSIDFPNFCLPALRRIEARLAAMDGDTASAIRVYREYLELRQDAEPVLVPQRDRVRAELARLTTR